jgi:hypothetical protein
MPFDMMNGYHNRLVMRIYTILKGQNEIISADKVDWESIGFQNKDNISTDFRATGVLGLLNLLYFLDKRSNSYAEIRRIFKLSTDSKQEFPFMIASFALSKCTLDALREPETLSYVDDSNLAEPAQDYFVALLRRLEERWREEGLTIIDFHKTIDQIRI